MRIKPQKSECPGGAGQDAKQTKSHTNSTKPAKFLGTDNPRHLRAIAALLRRPMPREALDKEAGCSNGPELVAELRRRGLELPCHRINFLDRDGFVCRPGVYMATEADRRKLQRWIAERKQGGSTC